MKIRRRFVLLGFAAVVVLGVGAAVLEIPAVSTCSAGGATELETR
jgi:hypothetical protein